MSGDPEQEFFADGITEDIITELSRFRELFVISRNSSFKYKGKRGRGAEVRARARRAVRRRGQRPQGRQAGAHHGAADRRRDRPPPLGRALRPRPRGHLRDPGRGHDVDRRDPAGPRRGGGARPRRPHDDRQHGRLRVRARPARCCTTAATARTTREAQQLLDRAIELDPNYAHAHAWKACVLGQTWVYNWCESRPETQVQIMEALQTALALDDNDCDVHRILAAINVIQDKHDQARLPPAARAEPQPERRPRRRPAGRDPDLARPAGGGHRVDQEGDAAQPLPPGALLEPPRRGPASRRAATARRSRR